LAGAATVAPFYYTFMLWAVLSGLVVFGDVPNGLAIAGMTFILMSGLALMLMDGRLRRLSAAASGA
jgi:drug/metabolite transporter (DMT)-like permease